MVALVNRFSDSRKAERCCLLGAIPSTEKIFPTGLGLVLAGSLEATMLQERVCCPPGFHHPVSVAALARTLNIPLPTHTSHLSTVTFPQSCVTPSRWHSGKTSVVESQWPLPVSFRVPCAPEPSVCHALFSNKSHGMCDPPTTPRC